MEQDPLLLVLLDLRKAYGNVDKGRRLQTIDGYGVEPKLRGLLAKFWLIQKVVTLQNYFHVPQLRETRGTPQGGLALKPLFTVSVDSVVRHWMSLKLEDKAATHGGLGMEVGWCMVVFYAYDGTIG